MLCRNSRLVLIIIIDRHCVGMCHQRRHNLHLVDCQTATQCQGRQDELLASTIRLSLSAGTYMTSSPTVPTLHDSRAMFSLLIFRECLHSRA